MTLRISQAQQRVANGVAGVTELPLPMLEGVVIVPKALLFTYGVAAPANAAMGLSHWRDHTGWTNTHSSVQQDITAWIRRSFGTRDVAYWEADPRAIEIELAGPQSFLVFNSDGATEDFACTMWYDVKRVSSITWAALARRTSFEDRE